MKTDDKTAQALRTLRGEKTQQWVAGAMVEYGHAWQQQTVYKIEKGKRSLGLTEAASLADIFAIPIQALFDADLIVAARREAKINRLELQMALLHTELAALKAEEQIWEQLKSRRSVPQ